MIFYDIINVKTQEVKEHYGSFDSLQEFLTDNPEWRQHFVGGLVTDAVNHGNVATRQHPTEEFKARIRHISKTHKMSNENNMVW